MILDPGSGKETRLRYPFLPSIDRRSYGERMPWNSGERLSVGVLHGMGMSLTRNRRPERWEQIPEAVNGVPGVWGNTMTFLGGPRNCIAYRFSVVE
jgi:hypothetical protein